MTKRAGAVQGYGSALALALVTAWPAAVAAQSAPAGSGLEAGGLAPPGSGSDDPYVPPPTPEQDLAAAEEKDSGRGLEVVWLNAEAGFEFLGLQTFRANNLVDAGITKTEQSGLMLGAGLGLRLVFITLGPRFRFGNFAEWQLWTLDGELGLHVPFGRLEPYFLVAGGYASIGDLSTRNAFNRGDVDIRGWNLRAGGGLDVYISKAFTVGGVVTGEMLFLTRPGVDPQSLAEADLGPNAASVEAVYAADGSSIGAALSAAAVLGLHF